jgi:hypothetical protein
MSGSLSIVIDVSQDHRYVAHSNETIELDLLKVYLLNIRGRQQHFSSVVTPLLGFNSAFDSNGGFSVSVVTPVSPVSSP